MKIRSVKAREILDSRGNPTIEVVVNESFQSSVSSGASRGKYEALELRDGGKRYLGKGVLKAVKNVNQIIAPKLIGMNVLDQKKVDQMMIDLDGTKNKSKLGANAILGVSMAICRAGSDAKKTSLYNYIFNLSKKELKNEAPFVPRPAFNIINGGAHAGNDLDFQEFMISPKKKTFSESLREASEIYHKLKDNINDKYSSLATNIGDEGGFAPPIKDPKEAIDLILKTKKVDIFLDVAAGEFFDGKNYKTKFKKSDLLSYYLELVKKYPIVSIEDPFDEDDWDKWSEMMSKASPDLLIIGDDLLSTNPERIKKAIELKSCNAMILKLNQIGTVSEGIEAASLARDANWKIMVSHRSGETVDDFIADFSVGISSEFIKSGAPARGERVAKYNRLLKIEEELLKQL
ncbi:MAG: phosphopyruvate hydratase [Candidatus Nealsonbacteria bacterium]|nr:phosphopyruvate hydratase [Candidatus Nealsonbacteria bacterium]